MEFIDYVIGISIGYIATTMATDINDKPLYYYLISMAIYFIFDSLITLLGRKSLKPKHFFKGKPLIITYNGEIDYKNWKKSKLNVNDLLAFLRTKWYFNLDDIAYAIIENNGNLGIMPKAKQRPIVASDIDIKLNRAELPVYLVIDGIISKSSLNEIKKTSNCFLKSLI